MKPTDIYCDGGVVSINPSPIGGTWAYCWVLGGEMVRHDSGFVKPAEYAVEKITNNVTELLAAIRALRSVPRDWDGTLHTDSLVTLNRLLYARSFNGVPYCLRDDVLELRRGRRWSVALVAGHPTKADLEAGRNEKGIPTSRYNVWCDLACGEQAAKLLSGGKA